MFRKPREDVKSPSNATPAKPSTGRAPTPPNAPRPTPTSTMSTQSSKKPLTPRPNTKSNMPAINKSSVKKLPFSKTPGKPNTSILNFFKKVDNPSKDESIFVGGGSNSDILSRPREPSEEAFDEYLQNIYDEEDDSRFNESGGSVKKRKISNGAIEEIEKSKAHTESSTMNTSNFIATKPSKPKKAKRSGPFLSDSDTDEDEVENASKETPIVNTSSNNTKKASNRRRSSSEATSLDMSEKNKIPSKETSVKNSKKRVPIAVAQAKWEALQPKTSEEEAESSGSDYGEVVNPGKSAPLKQKIPALKKEQTSVDEWGQFDGLEDFQDDEFADGEEFIERKWMEEQAILEAEGLDDKSLAEVDGQQPDNRMMPACPICSANLGGITEDQASRHVNGCLDGNPIPLPSPVIKKEESGENDIKYMPQGANNRFARRAAIARPGQANPINLGAGSATGPSTAFTAIMSGKAEDAAWATAAAAENASRGKPAYERTCPFYKIMPGFFICVDAFRYGAVQGCNAYFLSHFHSDHYIGLTSTWCHGPIYCSKVTANLVKQQLRVDPKWVVPLEFEVKSEVPGTQGVQITMIPANHCPGSSLFLFEKVVGKGANPKVQRILHCGDFRACPAHIAHPQLMPDVIDSITGKTKQQKIDVCYLDTTYLNPRYAFPSQEEVIKACADMCVSLKKERAEESDAWEVVKRQRAGAGMNSFVNNSSMKAADNSIAMEIGNTKPRGRLLVICGTYSIGKERICMGIARALDCKIWAPPGKMRICAALEDPELMSRMTDDPKEAQIHMQMLMEIRAETLQEYLNSYKPHFSRIVGFRPSGWNYRPPNSRFTDSPSVQTILNSSNWRSNYGMAELIPQRGSTREASCFGVPYSEHSSFRELTMFVCALRIEKVVPTVNVGSAAGRAKMKAWIERWLAERRKNGLIKIGIGEGEVKW